MDEELREKLIAGIEKSMLAVGGGKYSDGLQTARKLIEHIYEFSSRIQTVDALRRVLDECEPVSKFEAKTALFVMSHLPQIVRMGLKFAAQKATSTLPAPGGGRPPAIAPNKVGEVLDYVSLLHRQRCRFEVAIMRAAQKFGVSVRTVERLWAKRESIPDEELSPEPTMEEALNFVVRD